LKTAENKSNPHMPTHRQTLDLAAEVRRTLAAREPPPPKPGLLLVGRNVWLRRRRPQAR
jgi:hypothetical protein